MDTSLNIFIGSSLHIKKTLHVIDYFFIDDIPHSFMSVASGKWHLIETVCSTVVSEEQIVEHSLKTLWVAISNTLGSSTQPELTARQGE